MSKDQEEKQPSSDINKLYQSVCEIARNNNQELYRILTEHKTMVDNDLKQLFILVIQYGDIERVKKILSSGVNREAVLDGLPEAFKAAARSNHLHIVDFFKRL
jgi:hypothetical protein